MAHVSLITLGVDDLDQAARFYVGLGWEPSKATVEDTIVFLRGGAVVLALFRRNDLAVEAGLPPAYVTDPDGHLWEIAHNPMFPLDEDGRITLPDER